MKRELLLPRTRAKLPPQPEQTSSQLLSARGMWLPTVNLDTVRAMSTRLPRSISCRQAMPRGALEDRTSLTKPWCHKEGRSLGRAARAQGEAVFPCRVEEGVNTRSLLSTSVSSCVYPPGQGAREHRASLAKDLGGRRLLSAIPPAAALEVTALGMWWQCPRALLRPDGDVKKSSS